MFTTNGLQMAALDPIRPARSPQLCHCEQNQNTIGEVTVIRCISSWAHLHRSKVSLHCVCLLEMLRVYIDDWMLLFDWSRDRLVHLWLFLRIKRVLLILFNFTIHNIFLIFLYSSTMIFLSENRQNFGIRVNSLRKTAVHVADNVMILIWGQILNFLIICTKQIYKCPYYLLGNKPNNNFKVEKDNIQVHIIIQM